MRMVTLPFTSIGDPEPGLVVWSLVLATDRTVYIASLILSIKLGVVPDSCVGTSEICALMLTIRPPVLSTLTVIIV